MDVDTGAAKIVRIVEGTDVGQVIDPYNLKMQLEGGLGSCGSDSAITEEMVLDEGTGRFLTNNLVDFKWRVFPELPVFETHIEETPNDLSAFGRHRRGRDIRGAASGRNHDGCLQRHRHPAHGLSPDTGEYFKGIRKGEVRLC